MCEPGTEIYMLLYQFHPTPQLLECLASTSSQCISKLRRVRESGVATEPLLQVLCPVTTVLTSSLVQLIHTAVPVDQVLL